MAGDNQSSKCVAGASPGNGCGPIAERREADSKALLRPAIECESESPVSAITGTGSGGGVSVEMVHVFDLGSVLGFSEAIEYPKTSLAKKLSQWKMQTDDAPILRYLYRNARPRRHLEFGTWLGEGVLYCLEECDATVWTINLPFGEKGANYSFSPEETEKAHAWGEKLGLPKSDNYTSDSIGFIGKCYLEHNLGNRVCQIYCDSKVWDISNIPPGFFDTVLIDGGHTKDVVSNDTRKALQLARSGGIIMWHDFCPMVYPAMSSTVGVMDSIAEQIDWLRNQCSQLFWIYPSWILLGVKK